MIGLQVYIAQQDDLFPTMLRTISWQGQVVHLNEAKFNSQMNRMCMYHIHNSHSSPHYFSFFMTF